MVVYHMESKARQSTLTGDRPGKLGKTELQHTESIPPGYLGVTPPPGSPPQRGLRIWVDRPEQLRQAVNQLKQAKLIAIDTEFTQPRIRTQGDSQSSPILALMQLAIEHQCFVADTLRLSNLSPLAEVVANPEYSILLYGASADLRVMAERGLNIAHYYDLEAASRSIFGQQESSLAAMLRRAFNVRLDKSLQRTDWLRRPLPTAMIAYAARDAEMTLALYHWLDQHYSWALKLHENFDQQIEPVAAWIEPFLRGTATGPAEMVVSQAKAQGIIRDNAQVEADCRAALASLKHPMRISRLLRLIADLSLVGLAPDIEPLLHALAADERAASARALGRLGVKEAKTLIEPLLQDPVYDVRKAAQIALNNLEGKSPRPRRLPAKLVEGARSWTVGETSPPTEEDDWKARLRTMMDNPE